MKSFVSIAVAAVLFTAGCGKKDDARPKAPPPQTPPVNQEESKKTPVPIPPLPGPTVPKVDAAPALHPGHAGNHSTPAFKGWQAE